jgi:hypothetical protein
MTNKKNYYIISRFLVVFVSEYLRVRDGLGTGTLILTAKLLSILTLMDIKSWFLFQYEMLKIGGFDRSKRCPLRSSMMTDREEYGGYD